MFIHGSQAFLRVARVKVTLWMPRLDALVLLNSLLAVIKFNLFEDQLFVLGNFQTKQFEVEIEVTDRGSRRFIILKMQPLHVGMSKRLVNRYPTSWVKREHFLDQVDSVLIGRSEQLVEVFAARARKLAHECTIVIILDLVDKCCIRLPNQIGNHHHLFLLGLSGKERFSSNELSQNTTNTPYIDGSSVLAPGKNDFRCAVPSRGNIVCQACRRCHQSVDIGTCQAKVTDFQIAVGVNQQISRLQITMQDSTGVNVFQTAKDLIEEKLYVLVAQNLVRLDNLGQIGLHEIRDDVKFCELLE